MNAGLTASLHRRFVQELATRRRRRDLSLRCELLRPSANGLNLNVIGRGIETEAQAAAAGCAGAQQGQGFSCLAKPSRPR